MINKIGSLKKLDTGVRFPPPSAKSSYLDYGEFDNDEDMFGFISLLLSTLILALFARII